MGKSSRDVGSTGGYCRRGVRWSPWAGEGSLGKECCGRWMGRYMGDQRTLRTWVMVSMVVLEREQGWGGRYCSNGDAGLNGDR